MATTAPPPAHAKSATEIERLRAALEEGQRRERAVADVLRAMGRGPAAHQEVLDAIAEHASRLCAADACLVYRVVTPEELAGSLRHLLDEANARGLAAGRPLRRATDIRRAMVLVASYLRSPGDDATGARLSILEVEEGAPPLPPEFRGVTGVAVQDAVTVHIPDAALLTEADGLPQTVGLYRVTGNRTYLVVPMLVDGAAVGALQLRRREPAPFSAEEIALVETFAAQAAVAIAQARLVQALDEKNRTLSEALERERATGAILQAIASSPADERTVLTAICASAARLCAASDATVCLREEDRVRRVASHGPLWDLHPEKDGGALPLSSGNVSAVAVRERRVENRPDITTSPNGEQLFRATGIRARVAVPLLRDGEAIGALGVDKPEPGPFPDDHIALLQTFAAQAVIAIENARLFRQLNESNATLKEALEQQTATGEVLRAISASPAELTTVLNTIARAVARLCGADMATVFRTDGSLYEALLTHIVDRPDARPEHWAQPLRPDSQVSCAILEARTIHVPDIMGPEGAAFAGSRARGARRGDRTVLAVPLLREGTPLGAMTLRRREVRPFSEAEIALVETFADQAVIAMENARLFGELRERDSRRQQELERAAALQQRLLPASVDGWPGVLEVAVRFRPAVETSGDFYDVARLAPPRPGDLPPLQIAVGDVAGKGMAAALVTALARTALRATAAVPTQLATPANALRLAGSRLHDDVGSGHFVACALAVVEPPGLHNTGPLLRLANAAQVPVLLVTGGVVREIEPPGYRLPLGAQPDGAYRDAEVELCPGDVVVFSSDGLVEAPSHPTATAPEHMPPPSREAELLGFARLAASAAHWAQRGATAEDVAAGIWSDLAAWSGEASHHDDVTLLVLRLPKR